MHPTEAKTKLRLDIKDRIDRMTEGERHAEGRTLSRVLLQLIPTGSTVCAFFPLKTEVDIRLLLEGLLARGDTLFLPVFENNRLVFKKTTDLSLLSPGELTIPEPPKDAEKLEDQPVDIMLIPGRAFDRNGNRLGRGAGGYDRWLEKYKQMHPQTKFWGVCLECQLVPDVPVEAHDMRMDAVVTCRGTVGEEV